MTLRCAGLLEVTPDELERAGYTVFDMGYLIIRDTEAHSWDLADMRTAERVGPCLFIVESQIDRASTIQPFGSYVDSPTSSRMQYEIGPGRNLPSQEQIAIEVPLTDSWFPWLGLTVTPLLGPSMGNVHARAIYIRRSC